MNEATADVSIADDAAKRMDAESYALAADSPARRIYEAVRSIPKGCVATYGQIAELAGNKRMARAVGNALHKNPHPGVIPCHRVVDSKGRLAEKFAFGGEKAQEALLVQEGIVVVNGCVDLKQYQIRVK